LAIGYWRAAARRVVSVMERLAENLRAQVQDLQRANKKLKYRKYAVFYRQHLLELATFWEKRYPDHEFGGYFTCFDANGEPGAHQGQGPNGDDDPTNHSKYVWTQSRNCYTFSALYRSIDRDPRWLNLAKCGRDFLVAHAYAGGGRWHYMLHRDGSLATRNKSYYTDCNCLMALAEFALATGDMSDLKMINETFDKVESNFNNHSFNEFFHFEPNPMYLQHGLHMMCIGLGAVLRPLLGDERVCDFVNKGLTGLKNFVHARERILFEVVHKETLEPVRDTEEGQRTNPGHVSQSARVVFSFCVH
jgi:N-acylglucosamine 2-epimerase